MRVKILFFLLMTVPFGFRALALERQDSLKTIIGGANKVYFRGNSKKVVPTYRNNFKTLGTLIDTANALCSDTVHVNRYMKLIGNASPEGATQDLNKKLAEARAQSIKNYVLKKTSLAASRIVIESNNENWTALRSTLFESTVPNLTDVLNVIDTIGNIDDRKVSLKKLQKGTPYRFMKQYIFPETRYCLLTDTTYTLSDSTHTLSDTTFALSDSTSIFSDSISRNDTTSHLFLGVKTNLLYWSGISPEFKYRGFMPNLALEAYFCKRYSVHLEGVYTKLDKKNADKEIWAVSSLTLEPRFWLNADSLYTGFYAGLFGQYGDFDVKLNTISKTQGYTGTFFATGLSLGYHYAINNAFGLEVGLGVGYRQAKTNQYIFRETNHYYLEHAATESTFGLQQLRLSVVYRFSK